MPADNEFALAADRAKNAALARVEAKLLEAIERGDLTACIFYLKTRGGESWGAGAMAHEEPGLIPVSEEPEVAARIFGNKP